MSPGLDQLYKSLHVGAENELAGTDVRLWNEAAAQFEEVGYDVKIAKTIAGPVNAIPHVTLATDHPAKNPNRAMIEHVGGPRELADQTYAKELRIACQKLLEVLKNPGSYHPTVLLKGKQCTLLKDVLDKYNLALPATGEYGKFKLTVTDTPGKKWYIVPPAKINPSTQMNFEIPFRNIGRLPDGDEPNDFAKAFTHADTKKMFVEGRKLANETVNQTFRPLAAPRAAIVVTDPDSIKLEKLKSLFTLYYYMRVIEQYKRTYTPEKDSYELLPKAGVNDLIRTALSNRDRTILAEVTADNGRFSTLCGRMSADILKALQKGNPLRQSLNEPAKLFEIHRGVFRPGEGARYHGETAGQYGTALAAVLPVANSIATIPDTPTGKPLAVEHYAYDKSGVAKQEPVIVFEARHATHPFSQVGCAALIDTLTTTHRAQLLTHKQALVNAQTPFTYRPPKH